MDNSDEIVIIDLKDPCFKKNSRGFPEGPVQLKALESNTPFLQWGGHIYQGRWENMIGTELVFDESGQWLGQGRRRLIMERVQLVSKH
ncbi:hypothetical protein PNEG_01981 [Pneumocystis murina B123]|uniref:Transcription factor TFIIIC triple barrel domain-containing protein n=1 Tax=Pneumocystis murina (strain B123) TaxID=1069680 RepID=M7P7H9_PNEMU|nr:hypothetical protein PNEG_01981 [Pneumocystis murina B123]EMR09799.1 hypothetical protein PNEG_01981 [Pneumocystis murina B123]